MAILERVAEIFPKVVKPKTIEASPTGDGTLMFTGEMGFDRDNVVYRADQPTVLGRPVGPVENVRRVNSDGSEVPLIN